MKQVNRFLHLSALTILLCYFAQTGFSQTTSRQAMNWFQTGLAEKDRQKKIEAYIKAIEYDSVFVQAYYNLGLTYRKAKDYQNAATYFQKASEISTAKTDKKLIASIMQELAIAYQRQGDWVACEKTLREAKELPIDSQIHSEISFKLAKLLTEQGRFQEAKAELEQGRKISAENETYFDNYIDLVNKEIHMKQLYDEAEQALAKGDLNSARSKLELLRKEKSRYKDVNEKLAHIDNVIAAEQQEQELATLYEQARAYHTAENLELAIATYQRLLRRDSSYKDAAAQIQLARDQLEQKQLNETLQSEYSQGLDALAQKKWVQATIAFEKILNIDSEFRDTQELLNEAKRQMDLESSEAVVARYYTNGLNAMDRGDWGEALISFEKVRSIDENYKDIAARIHRIETSLQQKIDTTIRVPAAINPLDSLYQTAMQAITKQNWTRAIASLEQIQTTDRHYRDSANLLAYARANLDDDKNSDYKVSIGADSSSLFVGGAIAVVLVLPFLGFLIFSPTTRARLHSLRGNYAQAALIYERLLSRNPARYKLYQPLTNMYLLLGRRDEHAMRIYQKVLQLNLAPQRREEINAIVAKNYLTDGEKDQDAIRALESALDSEYRLHAAHRKDR